MINDLKETKAPPSPLPRLGIFLCSLSAISFEISLTRIFSISLWYHYAFMVVSIAMLGLGLSGTALSLFPNLRKKDKPGLYALMLGISIPLAYALMNVVPFEPARLAWEMRQALYMGLYYLILSVPFFFFGLVLSLAFTLESQRSALVYGADLLGAGAGSVCALLLIGKLGPERTVILIALAPAMAAFLFNRHRASIALGLVLITIFALFPNVLRIRISPYKELNQALLFPGASHIKTYQSGFQRVDMVNSPMARYAPGLSLSYLDELPAQLGITVDGTGMSAVTDARGGTPEFVRHLPSALPYHARTIQSALIVEPGGGLPVLIARGFGVSEIHVAESNPLLVDVIRDDFGAFSGGIYTDNTQKRLARSALRHAGRRFDLIHISMLGAVPSGGFGISEDYRFTLEAFGEYLKGLKEDGMLNLSMYALPPERTGLRVLTTAISALEAFAIKDVSRHVVVMRSWGIISILIKASPFNEHELAGMRGFASQNGFDLLYHHGIGETEQVRHIKSVTKDPYSDISVLMDPTDREEFIASYPLDISPTTDERPFFHYHIRTSKLREIYELGGGKWQFFLDNGYVLPVVLAQAALLSLLLLCLPLLSSQVRRARPRYVLVYFALLGLGFMFVEVPLIQKMILPFETPPLAVATVLASVLISSGIGSLLSGKLRPERARLALLAIAALSLPYMLWLPGLAASMSALPLGLRAASCFIIVFPLGSLMGIPFPLGMSVLGRSARDLIPWAWAVNGCFSVIGPLIAVLLAMSIGYTAVIMLGALMYLMAFPVLRAAMRGGQ